MLKLELTILGLKKVKVWQKEWGLNVEQKQEEEIGRIEVCVK